MAGSRRADIATIIYTSGTTGRPKGCELTHDNFVALTENTVERLGDVVCAEGASTLLFLPLAHVFARYIEVLCVHAGARLGHTADIRNLLRGLRELHAHLHPRGAAGVREDLQLGRAEGRRRGQGHASSRAAAETAIAWSRAHDDGRPGAAAAAAARRCSTGWSTARCGPRMGGQRRSTPCPAAAPLGVRLGHFYRGIGLTVLEGYGLTETTAPATVNTPGRDQDRHGRAAAARASPSGSPTTARSWSRATTSSRATATTRRPRAEAFVDGWFRTGDIGELDDDGFLRITGRKKELLVTAGGKNVAPAVLEDRLRAHPLVSQCIVVGDQKPFIAALVTLDAEMLPAWTRNHGLGELTVDQAARPTRWSSPRCRRPWTRPTRP